MYLKLLVQMVSACHLFLLNGRRGLKAVKSTKQISFPAVSQIVHCKSERHQITPSLAKNWLKYLFPIGNFTSHSRAMFSAPCPYAPLTGYDWAYTNIREVPPGCSALIWNPVVFFLLSAFQVCTIFIGVDLHMQLFYMFRKKKTLYFWYNSQFTNP
jgi:hypothetical protein